FSAIIKFKYDSTLPENITEKYLRMYWLDGDEWTILKNSSAGENTEIDMDAHIVWGRTNHFSTYVIAVCSAVDSDEDGLSDAEEINADGAPDAMITTFSDGSDSKNLIFDAGEEQTIYIDVPIYEAGIERVVTAQMNIAHNLYASEENQITSSPNNAILPSIYEDKITFMDDRNGNYDIYLYDLATETEIQITNDSSYDGSPMIWGEYIFWYRSMNKLYVKNYVTGEEWQVGNGAAGDIYDNYIVWPGVLYDIDTRTSKVIGASSGTPHIHGDYVAYVDHTIDKIKLYEISTETETIISTPDNSDPFLLDIGETYVIYQDWYTNDLYAYHLSDNFTIQITDSPDLLEMSPTISGDIAVWVDFRNSDPAVYEPDIYAYDIEKGVEFSVSVAPDIQNNPAIYGDRIVWQDSRNGMNSQLYLATMATPQVTMFIGEEENPAQIMDISEAMLPDFSKSVNNYIYSDNYLDDGVEDGFVTVPVTFSSDSSGIVVVSDIDIEVEIPMTNPLDRDTDNDKFEDLTEVIYGNNPNKVDYYWSDSAQHTIEYEADGWPYYTWYGAILTGSVPYVIHYNIISADNIYDYSSIRIRIMEGGQEIMAVNSDASIGTHSVTIPTLPSNGYYLQFKIHTMAGGGWITFNNFIVSIGSWHDSTDHIIECDEAGVPYHTWYNALTGGVPYIIHYNIASITNVNEEYSSVRVRLMSNGIEVLDLSSDASIGWHTITVPVLPVDEYYLQLKIQTEEGGGSIILSDFIVNVGYWQDITYHTIEWYGSGVGVPYHTWYNALTGGVPYVVSYNIAANDNMDESYSSVRVRLMSDGEEILDLSGDASIGRHSVTIPKLDVDKYYLQLKFRTMDGGGSVLITEFSVDVDNDDDGVGYYDDIDPLVDLEVTIKISEILALDDVDSPTEADFYLKVMIYDQWFQSAGDYIELDNDHIYPNLEFTKNVPDFTEEIYVMIELFDDDDSTSDDWCDISVRDTYEGDEYSASNTNADGRRVVLTYNLKYGTWSGDDSPGDANGYGHVSGNEDDNTGDDDDCEVWFDITQNDGDGDGLTYWQEVGPDNPDAYGTDPSDWDTDGDGMSDREHIYGSNLNPDSDADNDGMSAIFEVDIQHTDPTVTNDRYAILWCSESEWTDASKTKNLLENNYGFEPSNIWMLVGPDEATYNDLWLAFQELDDIADANDIVYIQIAAHGEVGYFQSYDDFGQRSEKIYYSQLNTWLNTINAMKMIVSIDACYSGSAIEYLNDDSTSRIIYTAVDDESLAIYLGVTNFGMFHTGFVGSLDPDLDKFNDADLNYGDGNGYVSFGEAFLYADDHNDDYPDEDPQNSQVSALTPGMNVYLGESKEDV
ncbi:MAG: hypothetical protein KAS32_07280, partial [Candidatus Peribacteraceae bacterium]|nr:hypothetical protein [Candidatus Peribacteraceae bacterium]